MGAWGTGVFENDTALDSIGMVRVQIDRFYSGLLDSDNEHNILLAGYLYLLVKTGDPMNDFSVETDGSLDEEIDVTVTALSLIPIEDYKYTLIGNLYKCLDMVNDWNEDCRESRKELITKMIDKITRRD